MRLATTDHREAAMAGAGKFGISSKTVFAVVHFLFLKKVRG
jgi:isoprenylcysteine carboxyl methyltransferase (ICMT) family protein YpbQ